MLMAMKLLLCVSLAVLTVHAETGLSTQLCRRSVLSQFKVKECKTALKTVSHDEFLPHDTTCFVTCSDKTWNGHGWRRCENGVWTGSPIQCKGIILSRKKRKRVCLGWWTDKRCADVLAGGTFSCSGTGIWRKCPVHYNQLRMYCPSVAKTQLIPDAGSTSMYVNWKQPTVYGGGGTRTIKGPSYGGYYWRGTHSISYSVSDQTGRRASCSFSFTVKARECPVPKVNNHLRVKCGRSNPVIYGTTCRYSCDPGYDLIGSVTTVCLRNETYDKPPPSCQRLKCSGLTTRLPNGYFICDIYPRFGDTCTAKCLKGFQLSGAGYPTCNASGLWSDFKIFCKDIEKPKIIYCPQSTVKSVDKNSNSAILLWEDVVAVDNSNEFNLAQIQGPIKGSRHGEGNYVIIYKVTDMEGLTDTCSFTISVEAVECIFPPDIEDKEMLFDCEGNMYGNKCNVSCRNNLQLEGDTSITCNKLSSAITRTIWKFSSQPKCISVVLNPNTENVCGVLPAPKNGSVACDRWTGGFMCSILCNDKYDTPRGLQNIDGNFYCNTITNKWVPELIPQCNVARNARYSVPGNIHLFYSGDCENKKDDIARKFYNKLKTDVARYQTICVPYEDCSADNVKVTCGKKVNTGRRKRDTRTNVTITWELTATFHRNNETVAESMERTEEKLKTTFKEVEKDINAGEFDGLVSGLETTNSTNSVEQGRLVCAEGLQPSYKTGTCRVCPLGTVYNKTRNGCDMCPRGTYQDEDVALAVCKPCGIGNTTLQQASTHPDNCTGMCNPGQYSRTGTTPCSSCVQGTYQPMGNSTSCLVCPPGTTTSGTGSQSLKDCSDFDLLMKNSQWIKTTQLITSSITNQYTIVTSLKVENVSGDFFLQFNVTETNIFNITFNDFTLTVNRGQNTSLARHDDWFYLVLNVDGSKLDIRQYSYSSLINNQTITVSNLQIKNGSSIGFTTIDGCILVVGSLKVMPRILTDEEILEQVSTCGTPTTSPTPVLSFDDLTKVQMSDVEIILGSSCDVYDECLSSPCNKHTCINKLDGYQCECNDGYKGTNCETPPDYCLLNSCLNNATCINSPETKNFTCSCSQGFKGSLCNVEIVNGGWTKWTNWTECSATCNGGITTRQRSCTNPIPEVDGLNCTGEAREEKSCSTDSCPVCLKEDLVLAAGVDKVECTGDKYDMICSPICKTGLVFKGIIPSYECRGNVWLSGKKTEPCTEPVVPDAYTAGVAVTYTLPDCDSKEAIKNTVENRSSHLPCSSNPNCTLKVTAKDCMVVNGSNTLTVKVSLHIPINRTAVKMSMGIQNGTDDVTRALTTLDEAGKMIVDDSEFFDVEVNGANYKSSMELSAKVSCEPGSFEANGICVKCSPGEYYNTEKNECVYCERGTYQPEGGQTSCLRCPDNAMTNYIGSDRREDCSNTNLQEEETKPDNNLLIYILVPVGIVLLFAGVAIVLWLVRRDRKTDSRKIPGNKVNKPM